MELTTTKQIETRVKRQIVLEDGKVVDDSGPIVTTNTTEDTDKKESEHTEVRCKLNLKNVLKQVQFFFLMSHKTIAKKYDKFIMT